MLLKRKNSTWYLHYYIIFLAIIYEFGTFEIIPYWIIKAVFIITFIVALVNGYLTNCKYEKSFFIFFSLVATVIVVKDNFNYYFIIDKIFTLIFICMIFSIFYGFISKNNFKIHLRYFIRFSYFLSIITILQIVLNIILPGYKFSVTPRDIPLGYPWLIRATSLFSEPAHLATFLIPSLYIGLLSSKELLAVNNIIKKHELSIIFISELLTFSVNGYIALLLIYTTYLIKSKKLKLIEFVGICMIILIMLNVFIFKEKIIGLFTYILYTQSPISNYSFDTSGVLYNSLLTLAHGIKSDPIFGTGFGNYQDAYLGMMSNDYGLRGVGIEMLRFQDYNGGSTGWIRIIVEFGLIGFVIILKYLFSHTIFNNKQSIIIIANQSFLFYLCFELIRFGGLATPYLYYFLAMLLVSFRLAAQNKSFEKFTTVSGENLLT
jgi:hypothetical protein